MPSSMVFLTGPSSPPPALALPSHSLYCLVRRLFGQELLDVMDRSWHARPARPRSGRGRSFRRSAPESPGRASPRGQSLRRLSFGVKAPQAQPVRGRRRGSLFALRHFVKAGLRLVPLSEVQERETEPVGRSQVVRRLLESRFGRFARASFIFLDSGAAQLLVAPGSGGREVRSWPVARR